MDAGTGVSTGGARQFTRDNSEYFEVADNADVSTGDIDFTLTGWVYLDSKPGNQTFIAKYNTGTVSREYRVFYDVTADRFSFNVSHNGSYQAAATVETDSLGIPSSGQWYFIVCEHDSVNDTLTIQANNGTVDSTAWSSGVYDGTQAFQLGRRNIGDYMGGRLARFGFWKRTLATAERSELYNSAAGLFYTELSTDLKVSLVEYWDLNEASGNALGSHANIDLTDNITVTAADGPGEGPATDGDPIAAWTDQSSNAKAFIQATIAKRPTYRAAGINGRPAIEFDGVDDLLVLAEDYLSGSEGTVIAAIELSASPSNQQVVLASGDESVGLRATELRAYYDGTNSNAALRFDDNTNDNIIRGDTEVSASTTYIQAWLSDGSAYTLRVNGTEQTPTQVSGLDNGNWFGDVTSKDSVSIGAYKRASEAGFLKGKLSELLVYDRELSAIELAGVERYLLLKYGVISA
jgi:hypothetical protein